MREGVLQSQVVQTLKVMGIFFLRLNSGVVRVRGGMMHLCPTGTADVLVLNKSGSPTWLELKQLKGDQRVRQKEFQTMDQGMGHAYHIIRSMDDLLPLIEGMR